MINSKQALTDYRQWTLVIKNPDTGILLQRVYDKLDIDYWGLKLSIKYLSK